MVAQHFAVVAGENDDGILRHAPPFYGFDDPAHLVVDQFDGRAVLPARNGHFIFGQVAPTGVDPGRLPRFVASYCRRHGSAPVPVRV